MDSKVKHLEMLQTIITRMANNSFLLKGWTVVLVSALFVLAKSDTNPFFLLLSYFPTVSFWILDGYYLWQERLYRSLYDTVRLKQEHEIDFSMDTSEVKGKTTPWHMTIFSNTLALFYGIVIATILAIMLTSVHTT